MKIAGIKNFFDRNDRKLENTRYNNSKNIIFESKSPE